MLPFCETLPSPNSLGNASTTHHQNPIYFLYKSAVHYKWWHVSLYHLNAHSLFIPLESIFHMNLSTKAIPDKVSNNPLTEIPVT